MTDARFPERWLNDRRYMQLPKPAFFMFMTALSWSVSNRTDGVIAEADLRLIPGATRPMTAVLVSAEVWEEVHSGLWMIRDFEETQTTRDDLEILANARRVQRTKKRRQRKHEAGDHSLCGESCTTLYPGTVPGYVPGDSTRTGQDKSTTPHQKQSFHSRERGNSNPPCAVPGCDRPARNSCRTCDRPDHMTREFESGVPS